MIWPLPRSAGRIDRQLIYCRLGLIIGPFVSLGLPYQ